MFETVGQWLDRRVFLDPDKTAVIHQEKSFTYREFNSRVNKLGNALAGLGVRKGDRVAGLMLNSSEFMETYFAAAKLGAIFVPLNFRLAAPEVAYILEDCTPRVVVYHSLFKPLVDSIHNSVSVYHYVCVEEAGDLFYEQLLAGAPDTPVISDVEPGDVQLMMYTSGTTGRPKGAMLTHNNTLWNAIQGINMVPMNGDDITLTVAPLFHIGGLNILTTPTLYLGGTVVFKEKFDPADCLSAIKEHKVTSLFLVPAMWLALTQVPDFDCYDLSSLRFGISGGAPCPLTVIEFFQQRGIIFLEGFGMTETAPDVCILRAKEAARKNGSVGLPMPHLEAKIFDDEDQEVVPGDVGELVLRGPNICRGYWNNYQATQEAFRGGWFHTGDLARQDDEGFFYIVDRKKDMIISGGENIYPVEVEQVLFRHPQILEVAVVGVPDEKWGEKPVAVVALKPGKTASAEEILNFAADKLARFKLPREVHFVEQLPRNATGKVLKTTLRQQLSDQ